jgi:hypothetical protein
VAAAAAGAILVAVPARAAPAGFAEIRAGFLRLDYEERDAAGAFLDGETGFVPSLAAEAELRGDRVFGRAALRIARGTVDYDGHTQSATDPALDGLPIRTQSDASFLQGELQVGGFVDDRRRVALLGALGARRWGRDILGTTVLLPSGASVPVSGLSEVYRWFELQAGVRWTFLSRPGTTWDLDGRLVRTAGAEVSVNLAPFGTASTATLALGSRTGWRVGSALRHDVGAGLSLAVNGWAERYAFGASAVDPVHGILEPSSETLGIGLEAGLGGRF